MPTMFKFKLYHIPTFNTEALAQYTKKHTAIIFHLAEAHCYYATLGINIASTLQWQNFYATPNRLTLKILYSFSWMHWSCSLDAIGRTLGLNRPASANSKGSVFDTAQDAVNVAKLYQITHSVASTACCEVLPLQYFWTHQFCFGRQHRSSSAIDAVIVKYVQTKRETRVSPLLTSKCESHYSNHILRLIIN